MLFTSTLSPGVQLETQVIVSKSSFRGKLQEEQTLGWFLQVKQLGSQLAHEPSGYATVVRLGQEERH